MEILQGIDLCLLEQSTDGFVNLVEWLVSFVFSSFVCCFITVLVSFWWEEHFWLLCRVWEFERTSNKQSKQVYGNTHKTYDKTKQQHCKCIKEDMYTNTQAINIFALTANPERHTKVWKSNSSNSNLKKNYIGLCFLVF